MRLGGKVAREFLGMASVPVYRENTKMTLNMLYKKLFSLLGSYAGQTKAVELSILRIAQNKQHSLYTSYS